MQITQVIRGSFGKIIQDREDIRFERSILWGGNRWPARGLQYATLLTTVEYSYAISRCSTDLRHIASYLPSRTKKRNVDRCSSCYGTLFSATAVTDTIYQYELRTAGCSSMIYLQLDIAGCGYRASPSWARRVRRTTKKHNVGDIMQILQVPRGNFRKIVHDRENVCLERSRSWNGNRWSVRGLCWATLLTKVKYSCCLLYTSDAADE